MNIACFDPVRPLARSIWQEVFEDSNEFLDLYFSEMYRKQDTYLATALGGEVAGHLQTLRYRFQLLEQTIPAGYVGGVATREKFRGQGIALRLMRLAHYKMYLRGDLLAFLIPANPEVRRYYQKHLGYASIARLATSPQATLPAQATTPCPITPSTFVRFRQYQTYLAQKYTTLLHSYDQWRTMVKDLHLAGGGVFCDNQYDYYSASHGQVVWQLPHQTDTLSPNLTEAYGMVRVLNPLGLLCLIGSTMPTHRTIFAQTFDLLDPALPLISGRYTPTLHGWIFCPLAPNRMINPIGVQEFTERCLGTLPPSLIYLLLQ